jgi:hypothetical protein
MSIFRRLLCTVYLLLSVFKLGKAVSQSGTIINVEVDAGEGLIYLLCALFFTVNFCTPVLRYIYVIYCVKLVEKAVEEAEKAQRRMIDRLSDAGRKVSQSVRSV